PRHRRNPRPPRAHRPAPRPTRRAVRRRTTPPHHRHSATRTHRPQRRDPLVLVATTPPSHRPTQPLQTTRRRHQHIDHKCRRRTNQPTLHDRLKGLPWADVSVGDRRRDKGHGRQETRTVKALTDLTPGGLGFPHAEQAVRITRTRTVKRDGTAKTSRETAYLVVSLPAEHAQPDQLQDWARLEWHIENRLHWIRDVTLREDATWPAPATAPPSPRSCATPPSDTTAPTAKSTSPEPP